MQSAVKMKEMTGVDIASIPYERLIEANEPVVLRSVVRRWPLVECGLKSADEAIAYLRPFDQGRPVTVYSATSEAGGRFFYNDAVTGPNYEAATMPLGEFLTAVQATLLDESADTLYVGSTDLGLYLPGFRGENDLPLDHSMFERGNLLASIWLGTRTTAAAHFDMSDNLACCAVGERRFTLFPPDQVHNLYPGPLEHSPGGQVVSMVDFRDPDLERFPRFSEAVAAARVVDLEPGDILFIPALWWHQVEALSEFNVLVNYWWNDVPGFIDNPMDTMMHGMLSLRDRPDHEKEAWRHLFDYYVLGEAGAAAEHLPDAAKGALGVMDDVTSRRLRAHLLRRLNR